jgi:hypothetical protein
MRGRTLIVADYFFGGLYIKRCKLNLRSVKYVERHAGHKALENLQRRNEDNWGASSIRRCEMFSFNFHGETYP